MPNMTRHIIINAQKKSRMLPLPELLNTHKTVGSAISSSNHWELPTAMGLLRRNDVTDIITINRAATITNCLRQGLLQRNDVCDIITINKKKNEIVLRVVQIRKG